MSIKFKNKEHEKFYEQCLSGPAALIHTTKAFFTTPWASAAETRKLVRIFNFREDAIRPEA